jgi:hypothetical protein
MHVPPSLAIEPVREISTMPRGGLPCGFPASNSHYRRILSWQVEHSTSDWFPPMGLHPPHDLDATRIRLTNSMSCAYLSFRGPLFFVTFLISHYQYYVSVSHLMLLMPELFFRHVDRYCILWRLTPPSRTRARHTPRHSCSDTNSVSSQLIDECLHSHWTSACVSQAVTRLYPNPNASASLRQLAADWRPRLSDKAQLSSISFMKRPTWAQRLSNPCLL